MRGKTAERLAREFEVSVRTIKRDLTALETSGVPLWSRPGPGGGYGIVEGGSLPPVALSPAQALALLAAVNSPPSTSRSVRSACEQAMTDQRVLRIDYISAAGEHTRRDVEPILFASTGGGWYLIGWCRLREAVRWFSLDRIHKAAVTSHPCSGHTIDEIGTPPDTAASVSLE